ncbi:hypothetical protein LFX25_03485 [Leptospira sp. FAT2]|uniref:hypothetical protein n=1 Tax=Leptospira sanjuanensis TaxID=2879643 RepID=UPI001EE8BDE4|nr:hypothetical protein [Leptospira sanjuanensis]MCG6192302.1 hypothetical protein [Leptospira sanjuanensis]
MKNINDQIYEKMTSKKAAFEENVRDHVSEHSVKKAHTGIYLWLKNKLGLIINRVSFRNSNEIRNYVLDKFLGENVSGEKDAKPITELTKIFKIRTLIFEMRVLLNRKSLEKDLQNKFREMLLAVSDKYEIRQEVYVKKKNGLKGRIDNLSYFKYSNEEGTIFELKNAKFTLALKRDKFRIPKKLYKAILQVFGYWEAEIKNSSEGNIDLTKFNKIIIAGRWMDHPEDYFKISEEELKDYKLKIYSWDAWLAEYERVFT